VVVSVVTRRIVPESLPEDRASVQDVRTTSRCMHGGTE
jgi:hypothetical protein